MKDKFVLVEYYHTWQEAGYHAQIHSRANHNTFTACGIVIADTEDELIITLAKNHDHYFLQLPIPKQCIKSIKRLHVIPELGEETV